MHKKVKGDITEKAFQSYLEKHHIPYWYIQQDVHTFSTKLKQFNVRRPDFFILIPNFGFVLIDVEHVNPLTKYKKFCVCDIKTQKYTNLQKLFNMQVWLAFSNAHVHYSTWYFIPVSKVLQYRKQFLVKEKNYISIPIDAFQQVASTESFLKVLLAESLSGV